MDDGDGVTSAMGPTDRAMIAALLAPGERVVRASPADAGMTRGGVVAVAAAVPAVAIGWFPLHKALAHGGALAAGSPDRLPFWLFTGFGLLWIAIGLRLLWEPWRRHRLYPHVVHVLTDRRFLEIDRRSGPIHVNALGDIWQMKIFSPFGRLTFWRRRFYGGTGKNARTRDYDGVRDVVSVAQRIAELTGVPVGVTRRAVADGESRLPPDTPRR